MNATPPPTPHATPITQEMIRDGLTKNEFFLEYLPTVSLETGCCTGAEALIRWRRDGKVIPPLDFIPLAENTPVSGLLTYWVIDQISAELTEWLRCHPDAQISINVPPEILGRGGMEYAARSTGLIELAPQMILEITERGVPDTLGVEAINNLWGRAVRVALDDVTHVGGANLAVLMRCNISIIKLDKSLTDQIQPGSEKPEWLDGLKALLNASNLSVVAEGVEDLLQVGILKAAGIQSAQGYFFSRPLVQEKFIAFYEKHQMTDVASQTIILTR
jgi:sensor c-di-GMP phosphodiesterase-like protein